MCSHGTLVRRNSRRGNRILSSDVRKSHEMNGKHRRAAAIVEFALVLPFIMFVFLVGADWCRIFFVAHTVQDCARNGALGASGIAYQEHDLSDSVRAYRGKSEALKDASNLSPPLQPGDVSVVTTGDQVSVTVTYGFQPVTNWPGIEGPWEIQRTVQMPILP